jgi:hypothetical protein
VRIAAGGVIEFSADAGAAPAGVTPFYSWRRDGVPLSNGGRVFGADTPGLTIVDATEEDIGAYDLVVVWHTCPGAVSSPAAASVSACCVGDANSDGVVNFADITAVLLHFGLVCPGR